jgi:hypothetical protein
MNQVLRIFFVILVTLIIVVFVTDFESVVGGFESLVDGVSTLLSPIKGVFK